MYRYKLAHAAGVEKLYADKIDKLKQEMCTLHVELERRTAMQIKNEEARVRIACELASYKLRNMR